MALHEMKGSLHEQQVASMRLVLSNRIVQTTITSIKGRQVPRSDMPCIDPIQIWIAVIRRL